MGRAGGDALGGALFVASALIVATMPQGCIGDECALWPMRETGLAGALLMLALLLVVVGTEGLVIRVRNTGRFGELAKAVSLLPRSGPRCRRSVALYKASSSMAATPSCRSSSSPVCSPSWSASCF